MQVHWAKLVAKFWNRLAMSEGSTLGKRVLRDILQRAQSAGFQGNDWGSQVLRMFRALGHNLVARAPPASQEPAALVEWLAAQQVPVSALLEELERRLRPEWTASELQCNPRSFLEGGRNVKVQRQAVPLQALDGSARGGAGARAPRSWHDAAAPHRVPAIPLALLEHCDQQARRPAKGRAPVPKLLACGG